jgi:hypothetical protein
MQARSLDELMDCFLEAIQLCPDVQGETGVTLDFVEVRRGRDRAVVRVGLSTCRRVGQFG